MTRLPAFLLPAALLASCASPGDRDPAPPGPDSEVAADLAEPAPPRASPLAATLASDAFRERFAASYLAETDVEPAVDAEERELLVEVMAMIAADELDEAAERIVGASSDHASAVLDFTLGNLRYQQDRLEEAADAYTIAVAKHPKFRRAWGNLAQIRFRQERFAAAADALARVIALGGGDAATYGMLGIAQSRRDDPVAAESAFRIAVMLAPDRIDWKLGLADAVFRQQRFEEAAKTFDVLLATAPERVELWLAQGEAFARLGRPLEAAANFELVDRLGGSTAGSLYTLADIYANAELHDLAADAYRRALGIEGAGVQRAIVGARHLAAQGAGEDALRVAEAVEATAGEALTVEERKDLLRLRARIAAASGAGAEELRVLEEIVELDPLDGDALILLGRHHARAGDAETAIFWFERAAGIEAVEADARVRHAQVLVGAGRYAEALPLLRRAQSLRPREHVGQYLEQVERVAGLR